MGADALRLDDGFGDFAYDRFPAAGTSAVEDHDRGHRTEEERRAAAVQTTTAILRTGCSARRRRAT
jgi:hypothetical protein